MRPSSSLVLSFVVALLLSAGAAHAGDLRITLPKRSKPTPVQKLNQEGVRAIKRHRYDEARKLFYRAYLLDPDDPFTLNNLGYISELQGDVDRAQRFYDLAAQNASDATIARSIDDDLQGKPVSAIAGKTDDRKMQINRYNVQALSLLQKDRAPEADLILQKALAIDPRNPFTLNNLGYAKEKEGELETAYTFYTRAANANSNDPIVVTANKDWRGKGISEIASNNARKLQRLMEKSESVQDRVARLNLEGVSAINRNDRADARKFFRDAYRLQPDNAFTLNNMGYLSEMEGDRETADFYYEKAAEARGRDQRVTVSTRYDQVGRPLARVAEFGDDQIAAKMEQERMARMREGGPIALKTRSGEAVVEPAQPPPPLPEEPIATHDEYRAPEPAQPIKPAAPALPPRPKPTPSLGPLPGSNGPAQIPQPGATAAFNPGNVTPPLPESQQSPAAHGQQPGAVMPPLPDGQQPPAAQGQQPGTVMPPLPDGQQPPAARQPPE